MSMWIAEGQNSKWFLCTLEIDFTSDNLPLSKIEFRRLLIEPSKKNSN